LWAMGLPMKLLPLGRTTPPEPDFQNHHKPSSIDGDQELKLWQKQS
jgi:hypothetical protein